MIQIQEIPSSRLSYQNQQFTLLLVVEDTILNPILNLLKIDLTSNLMKSMTISNNQRKGGNEFNLDNKLTNGNMITVDQICSEFAHDHTN